MNKLILLFAASLLNYSSLIGSVSDTLKFSIKPDDPKFSKMDSLWSLEQLSAQHIETDTNKLNMLGYTSDSIPVFSDSLIQLRLSILNNKTPFGLVYNQEVKKQITIFANIHRNHISRMLGKANYYFPLFESQLDKFDLPLEFKYLAIVESALKPHARSRSAATGLWQFMYTTGKIYNLNVTSYLDERSDPLKSTIAACEYFTFLYKMFNDWELVLAAYNGGPGYVSRAMRKSGAKDYWSVRPYLREETQNYVPKFIAVNYIMNYASEHNIYPKPYKLTMAETDTLSINQSMTFEVLSKTLGIDIELIKELNPMYKRNLIPVSINSTAVIRLPYNAVATFINNSDSIYAYSESLQEKYVAVDAPIVHRVNKGEYLGKIANKYHTTIGRIKNWNNLSSDNLSIGQKLVIYVNPDSAPNSQSTNKRNSKGETVYTVKSGDTLWDIARKYLGVSVAQIEQLNNITYRDLKPGLKLKIPKTG